MKKSFLILAAVAAATLSIASCQKAVVDNGASMPDSNEIQIMSVYASNPFATKAAGQGYSSSIETTTEKLASFKMYAWSGDNKFIDGTEYKPVMKKDSTSEIDYWSDGNKYYWAADKNITYTFVGLANNNASAAFGTVTKGQIDITDYEVKTGGAEGTAADYTHALGNGIYADADELAANAVSQDDPCVSIATGNSAEKVTSMTFYHMLTRVRVAAKATIASTVKVKVKFLGYEFRGVGVKGSASITNASSITWGNTPTLGCVRDNRFLAATKFDGTGGSKGIDITGKTDFLSLGTDSWCNVIPGTKPSSLVVKVAFYDSTTGDYIATRYLTSSSITSDVTSLAAGTQYTYKVSITGNGGTDTDGTDPDEYLDNLMIKVTGITVAAWDGKDGGTVNFE